MLIAYGTPDYPLEPLATATVLAGFNGGPFAEPVVAAAGDSIREECGWHIAPEVTTILRFHGDGDMILLPTLRLRNIESIKDRDGNLITGYDWYENGVVKRAAGFPSYVEVKFWHGYQSCPRTLLPIIAERAAARAKGRVKSEALAGRSVTLEGGDDPTSARTIATHTLPPRP